MKFAHLADTHLGAWRDPELRELNIKAFETAIDKCIEERVEFVIFAGDLFDTAMPAFDVLEKAVMKLRELKENDIKVFGVAGSHDYSPSGKTFLNILENAGLLVNVAKGKEFNGKLALDYFDISEDVCITGMFGKPGSLEKQYYEILDVVKPIKKFNIFVFHSPVESCMPKDLAQIEALPLSLMPSGFDYYAGGHIHNKFSEVCSGKHIVYPGMLFPCDFHELENFKKGSFAIVDTKNSKNVKFIDVELAEVKVVKINADDKSAKDVQEKLMTLSDDVSGKIVLLKVYGCLSEGKLSDINFSEIHRRLKERGALAVKKNTNKLTTKEYNEVKIESGKIEELEEKLIKEHLGQIKINVSSESSFIKELMNALMTEKKEGETNANFESRIISSASSVLRRFGIDDGQT